MRFSNKGETVFMLNKYEDKKSMTDAINNIPYVDGKTNTADGIRIMHKELFTFKNGDRSDVQNIAIVMTDGDSTVNVSYYKTRLYTIIGKFYITPI